MRCSEKAIKHHLESTATTFYDAGSIDLKEELEFFREKIQNKFYFYIHEAD